MSANRVICACNDVTYLDIRKAMIAGARTLEEIQEATGAGSICGTCVEDIEEILGSVCGCTKASLKDVVEAVHDGADTVEKVGEATKAGTCCGRCKPLVQNVIDLKK